MRDPGKPAYSYSEGRVPTLWATSFAVMALDHCGGLDKLTSADRSDHARWINDHQDEATGYFVDPLFTESPKVSQRHGAELFQAHSSTISMGAVVLLGSAPKHRINWVAPLCGPRAMEDWLDGLPWQNSPWIAGNWSYDLGCAMGMDYLISGDPRILEGMDAYFNWYDKNQDSETGWWDLAKTGDIHGSQYGGYHTLMVYRMFDRPVGMPDRMIDSCLSLQNEDGLFATEKGGGCCQDMDVIDTLEPLAQVTDYRSGDITSSFERALKPLLCKQNRDGGFFDSGRHSRTEFGWAACSAKSPMASDLCSTWFQAFSVSLVAEHLGISSLSTRWKQHTTYCHGVSRPIKIK